MTYATLLPQPTPGLGYLVWTKMDTSPEEVSNTIAALKRRGISKLRTGISWTEWELPQGREWIQTYMRLYAKELKVLPCFNYTPPWLGLKERTNAPPKDVGMFARFIDDVATALSGCFTEVELWNEFDLDTDWDSKLDPGHRRLAEMLAGGAYAAKKHGLITVLGGVSKVAQGQLQMLRSLQESGALDYFDVVGIHNLRGTWSDRIPSPPLDAQVEKVRTALERPDLRVWLTEYGFPPVDPEKRFSAAFLERVQVALFAHMAGLLQSGALERAYWYTYKDRVAPSVRYYTTGWEDTLQHHYGDTKESGTLRLLGQLLEKGGAEEVLRYAADEGLAGLVDKASLGRTIPAEYRSNSFK